MGDSKSDVSTSILILEDNPQTIRFYENIFSVSSDWEIIFSSSFDKALDLLNKKTVDYVISEGFLEDSSMTGLEFLKQVSELYPEIVKLYISSSIAPVSDDYYYFHAYINKAELDCNSLLEVMNCMTEETMEFIPV